MTFLTPEVITMVAQTKAESLRKRAEDYRNTALRYEKLLQDKLRENPLYAEQTPFCKLVKAEFKEWIHMYLNMAEQADAFAAMLEAEALERMVNNGQNPSHLRS